MDERRYREVESRLWDSLGVAPKESMVALNLEAVEQVRLQELGDGPAIVMVHGGAVGGSSWAPLAAELNNFRCIVLDRPGCGLSPKLRRDFATPTDFTNYAGQVVPALLDALDLDRAHVLCTSLGGLFGFHTAAQFPARVDRLVGIGGIFGSPMDNIPLVMRIGSVGHMPKLMAHMPPSRIAVRAMLRQIGLKEALEAGRISTEFEDWFLSNLKYTDSVLNDAASGPSPIDMRGMRSEFVFGPEILAAIEAPTKLIWGESDPMAGADIADAFARQLPNADLELWPNTGHAPWVDDAARAAESISDFLS